MGRDVSFGTLDKRKKVLEAMDVSEDYFSAAVSKIKNWLEQQKHLPEIADDILIEKFLLLNKLSIEVTKVRMDMYYTIRSMIPELYENRNPKLPHMQEIAETTYFLTLPNLTEELYLVNIFKMADTTIEKFNATFFFAHVVNVAELKLREDYATGEVFVYDLQGCSLRHLQKVTPTILQKITTVAEKVFSSRIKGIHYVNCPLFVDSLVTLAKAILKPKIAKRIHVHNSLDSLYKFIPKEILPEDYGGNEKSLKELNEIQKNRFKLHESRFEKLDSMRVYEALRPTKLENDEILGFYWNFRTLSVD